MGACRKHVPNLAHGSCPRFSLPSPISCPLVDQVQTNLLTTQTTGKALSTSFTTSRPEVTTWTWSSTTRTQTRGLLRTGIDLGMWQKETQHPKFLVLSLFKTVGQKALSSLPEEDQDKPTKTGNSNWELPWSDCMNSKDLPLKEMVRRWWLDTHWVHTTGSSK